MIDGTKNDPWQADVEQLKKQIKNKLKKERNPITFANL